VKKIIKLNTHPYPADIWFTEDLQAFNRKRTAVTGLQPVEDVFYGCVSVSENRGSMVIGVFDGNGSTLVHESAHAAINVFTHIGMDVNEQTTEAFAYLQESIYRQCTHLMDKLARYGPVNTQQEARSEDIG